MKKIVLCLALSALTTTIGLQAANTQSAPAKVDPKAKVESKADPKTEPARAGVKMAGKAEAQAASCGMSCCGASGTRVLLSPKAAELARR